MTQQTEIQKIIEGEHKRQSNEMELIASENYQSRAVLEAQASVLANKYAEGYPWRRYYAGQEFTDKVEQLAIDRAKKLFNADHANVQALSWAAANLCIYAARCQPGDTIIGMDLSHGGHLTHGAPVTFFSKVFNFVRYKTLSNGEIDYKEVEALALKHKPKIILAGFSAYSRNLDYKKFATIAHKVWAIAVADMSHIWWLIAAKVLPNPLDYGFHVMMTTTHKSLRGPRGALILSKWVVSTPLRKPEQTIENLPTIIDRSVFPGMQWWPHMNVIAAIAVALEEAATPAFREYAAQTIHNAQTLADELIQRGYKVVTNGTDNHMIILDFTDKIYGWREAEKTLEKIWISTSKSTIPDDPEPPFRPSGLRIGMPAMTTRGVKTAETKIIADFIDRALNNQKDEKYLVALKKEVATLCKQYPIPS